LAVRAHNVSGDMSSSRLSAREPLRPCPPRRVAR